jgi:phosphoglycolate phosphatase
VTPSKQATINGIIFDFDGTLLDSAPDLMATVNKILKLEGRRPVTLNEVQGMIGDGMPTLLERALNATGGIPSDAVLKNSIQQFVDIYTGEDAELNHLYPGAVKTLQSLKEQGFTLALCTNKPITPTMAIVRKLDIEQYFSAISGGDSIPKIRKPDPRHLLAIIEELGMTPKQVVMIGDKEHDIHCARDAGVHSLLVSFGYAKMPLGEIGADAIIDHLPDVADAVQMLSHN